MFLRAAESDLNAGIDLTGQTSVTTSQLLQLVNSGTINTNGKGGIIRKATRPDVTTYPRYTNWLWLSIASDPPTLKSYVPSGDSDTNWIAATIGSASISAGNLQTASVTAGKLAANSVNTSNLVDNAVTDSKITAGAVTSSKIASGSVSNAHIASATITGDRLSTLTITDTNIAAATITGGKLVTGTVGSTQIEDAGVRTNDLAVGPAGYFLAVPSAGGTASPQYISFFSSYTTNGISLPAAGSTTTNSHTLLSVPSIMRVTLACQSAELGFNVGDEIPVESLISSAVDRPYFSLCADASNWYFTCPGTGVAGVQARTKTNIFAFTTLTPANWRVSARLYKFTAP